MVLHRGNPSKWPFKLAILAERSPKPRVLPDWHDYNTATMTPATTTRTLPALSTRSAALLALLAVLAEADIVVAALPEEEDETIVVAADVTAALAEVVAIASLAVLDTNCEAYWQNISFCPSKVPFRLSSGQLLKHLDFKVSRWTKGSTDYLGHFWKGQREMGGKGCGR